MFFSNFLLTEKYKSWFSQDLNRSWFLKDLNRSWFLQDLNRSWFLQDLNSSWFLQDLNRSWFSQDLDRSWFSQDLDRSWFATEILQVSQFATEILQVSQFATEILQKLVCNRNFTEVGLQQKFYRGDFWQKSHRCPTNGTLHLLVIVFRTEAFARMYFRNTVAFCISWWCGIWSF